MSISQLQKIDVGSLLRLRIVPASRSANMVESTALATISELLQLENIEAALDIGNAGWRAEIKEFVRHASQGSLLRAMTGLCIGHNLLGVSVFSPPELPDTGAVEEAMQADEEQTNNPFAAIRQVRYKRQ